MSNDYPRTHPMDSTTIDDGMAGLSALSWGRTQPLRDVYIRLCDSTHPGAAFARVALLRLIAEQSTLDEHLRELVMIARRVVEDGQ